MASAFEFAEICRDAGNASFALRALLPRAWCIVL